MNAKQCNDPMEDKLRNRMRQCIPAENLSAELDGEYHFTPDEQAHLEHCPRCRMLYESYRVIDDAVTRSLSVNCPRQAACRIRKNVNRKLDELAPMRAHEHIRFSALAARVAAAVVIAAMAGYLIFIDNPYSGELEDRPDPRQSQKVSSETHSSTPETEPSPLFPGGVDVRNLRLAATGNNHSVRFMDPAAASVKAEHVALIPETLKQVWIFDPEWKAEQMEKQFRTALGKAEIPLRKIKLEVAGNGTLRMYSRLSRYQTVMLTRFLAEQQFQLMTPGQPQPEQKLFAGTGREAVQYEAVFLPRGK